METISNIPNEIMFVGCIYKSPELFVEYAQHTKSRYDFYDEATRFFYDCGEILFTTRTQTFTKNSITTFMAEDKERLELFKKYGGWQTIEKWASLANTDDAKNYFEILKKYSLLREYQRNGFDIDKIVSHSKFETFTAMDIYRLIRGKADRIHTVILANTDTEILNRNTKTTLISSMEKPDMGITIPFPIINEIFRGMKLKTVMSTGMVSNAGKTRLMAFLIAYVALVLHHKVFVMLNEMSIEEMRYALITTVINNPEFQELHGIKMTKIERELTLGLYRDNKNELMYQKVDENGNPAETLDEYIERVSQNSEEFQNVMRITEWIDSELQASIFIKDVSTGYDDKTLEFEIRKAKMTLGVNYWFYDTFKSDTDDVGDWAAMMVTATKLTEIAKDTDTFGYLSIQLTDDALAVDPDRLSSSHIANCKAIKRVMYTMILFKEILPSEYKKFGYYKYDEQWGEPLVKDIPQTVAGTKPKKYYCCNVDKNRFGRKCKLLFEVDLDTNIWTELGELTRK